MKRTNVEAEKNELVLQNEAGVYAIIPADRRNEVLELLDKGCDECIDSIVASLPKASDYAQDGSVIDPIYSGGTFPTTNVTEEAPNWLKFKREFEQSNTFDVDSYVNERFNNPRGRQAIDKINEQQFRQDLYNEAKQVRNTQLNKYVADKLLQTTPQDNKSRRDYLNQFNDKEQQIIKQVYPKYAPSLYTDTKRGLTSLVENNAYEAFSNILNSNDYTDSEKREMLQDYINHPVMSKLGDAAKILSPLLIPSKMVQASYKDDYSLSDALQGKKNKAGIVEDIVTDPLNLVGLGIWSKLSKGGKFSSLDDAYKAVKGLSKEEAIETLSKNIDNIPVQQSKQPWQMQELPGLHLKSTMEGEAISKIVEPKTGLINVEQALGIIGKESGGADKVKLVREALGDNIPKKMDFNEFRKVVQDQLIPLERQFSTERSNYGLGSIGYPSPKRSSFETALSNIDSEINNLNNQITKTKSPIKTHYGKGMNGEHVYSYESKYGTQYYGTKEEALAGQKRELDDLTESLNNSVSNKESNVSKMKKLPLENQTLILGNKSKFGRGSSAHGNPDETLGHAHFLRDAETPDIITATQLQSDPFQSTYYWRYNINDETRKIGDEIVSLKDKIKNSTPELKKELTDKIEILKKELDPIVRKNTPNYEQKVLLEANHEERILQELVDYAGKRGDVNKLRVPTSETAAKVQGYSKHNPMTSNFDKTKYPKELGDLVDNVRNSSRDDYDNAVSQLNNYLKNNKTDFLYSSEHQTILKKYSEQPKTIKKLFGQEPTIVTDSKGNTWYEFDIPDKFKKGKGEIKAFGLVPLGIGVGTSIQNQSNVNSVNSNEPKIKAEDGLVIDPPTNIRKKLLDTIGQLESNNQYDVLYGGKRNPDLVNMTIGEVIQYQRNLVNEQKRLNKKVGSAAGRYQFIPDTLNDLVREGVVSLNDRFSPETQDKMAIRLLKRKGLNKYEKGEITAEEFADNLSKEWASLPYNDDMSYYKNVGTNKSLISRSKFMQNVFGTQQQVAQQQPVQEEVIAPTDVILPTEEQKEGGGGDMLPNFTPIQPLPTQNNIKEIDFSKVTSPTITPASTVSNEKLNLPKQDALALRQRFAMQGYIPNNDFLDVDILKVALLDNVGKLGKFDNYPLDDDSVQKLVNTLKDAM